MTRNERIVALRVKGLTYEAIGTEVGVNPIVARAVCRKAMKRGEVTAAAIKYKPHTKVRPRMAPFAGVVDRILRRINKDPVTGCWNWTGPSHKTRPHPGNRYGYIGVWDGTKNRTMATHRAMWIGLHGPLPSDQVVCHHCDNVLCCNPDHLFIGTMLDNVMDSVSKGRHANAGKTHCKRGHELSGDNLYIQPNGTRNCKQCQRDRLRDAYRQNPKRKFTQRRLREQQRQKYQGEAIWHNGTLAPDRVGQPCKILSRPAKHRILVEFMDGTKIEATALSVRRPKAPPADPDADPISENPP